jgi:NCAIR mutase (PurE)-related protein
MTEPDFLLDTRRDERIRLSEAIFCAGKSPAQIAAILGDAEARGLSLLLTRLDEARFAALPPPQQPPQPGNADIGNLLAAEALEPQRPHRHRQRHQLLRLRLGL